MRDTTMFARAARLDAMTNRSAMLLAAGIAERTKPCYAIENADDGERARVYVYDVIGGWYLDSAEFVKDVHAITAPNIDLHVNSPGGLVFDAVSMFEAVRNHPAHVDTHIDGLAASAASFVALAGDTVEIARGGRVMIHDAAGIAIGNASDMREYADLLDAVSDDISGYYAEKAGGSAKSWRTAMQQTTWYSAAEAVEVGLADRVAGGKKDDPEDTHRPPAAVDARSQIIRARHSARHRVALGGVL